MREILRTLVDSARAGRSSVLCSLVETRGSTPQKAGASMLVFSDGTQAGTLGGGCVEAEVKQRALGLIETGQAELLTFHLDDNYGWDDGLICGGRMLVLAEPIRTTDPDYFIAFRQLLDAGQGCTEAVVVDNSSFPDVLAGARVLFDSEGKQFAAMRNPTPPALIAENLPDLSTRPRATSRSGVAYLPVVPRCRLVIVGAGHVGHAVGQLAAQADFDIWVIDDRATYANAARFPAAQRIIVGNIGDTLKELPIDVNTYCIIVTRGHSHDEEALFHLAERPARYIGMIGSKRKIRLIFDDLLAAGISATALDRVRAPLGLNIGSQTVPEIAVSIVAELIAHRNLGSLNNLSSPLVSGARASARAPVCELQPADSDALRTS